MVANDCPPSTGLGKGSHVRGVSCSLLAHTGVQLINRTFNIPPKSEDEKEEEAKAEEEEEEKEEIHEVGQNSASFQSKPIENYDPFLRLFKEDSGGPNPAAWMVHPIVHKATQDRVNERNTLTLGLIPPSPQKSKR